MEEPDESERGPESTGPVAARYDIGDDEPPSLALVAVLSTLAGVDETEMRSLYTYVDVEAVDTFLESAGSQSVWSGSVQLELNGSVVFVNRDAVVVMADPEASTGAE